MKLVRTRLVLLLSIAVLALAPVIVPGAEIPEDRGAMGLAQALERLDVVGSVLHTGAHPDDENSALLAWLSRGQGVRTAYLSITRGEGGVNLLGTELFEALGVIRTEELFAARRLDRAQQFFTPNYEFGFSKNAEEGLTRWGHEQLLGDFVRVIRQFRPEIIISRFTGTPRDGHGHHQVAGIITQEAFKAAADPSRFPEYGKPWQAKKLYLNPNDRRRANPANNPGSGAAGNTAATQGANAEDNRPSLQINVGEFNAALGRSYSEIASEGRSFHRSQAQGSAQEPGPRMTRLQLVQKTIDVFDTAPLFQGTLYKLTDLAQLDAAIAGDLTQLEQRITAIRQKVNLLQPSAIAPDLAAALKQLQSIRTKTSSEHVRFLLDRKESDFQEALRLSTGLVVEVLTSDDTVVPGQEFEMTVSAVNGGPYDFSRLRATTDLPPGWDATFESSKGDLRPGQRLDQKFKVKVASNAKFTQPYWLLEPRHGDRFVWPQVPGGALPTDEKLLPTQAEVDFQGITIAANQPAEFRRVNRMLGEERTLPKVVPSLSVSVAPGIVVVPLGPNQQRNLTVTVENQNPTAISADVSLVTPTGWGVTPASRAVSFAHQGEKASLQFTVSVPPVAGDFVVKAVAKSGSQEFRTGYTVISYPHIQARYVYAPAESKVEVVDVKTRVTSVGYVEGTGDSIPDALRQLGISVKTLEPRDIASGDLSQFPAIVLGVRAYAVRDDLRAYNKRLLDYVSNGGTLVVQYNRGNEVENLQIGPYPFTMPNVNVNNKERVTREDAPVRILDPTQPVLSVPNKITEKDFEGWVDERGTFFLSKWDPMYAAPLESNDPGEPPRRGGLVIGKYGKGFYVYTGYSLFRQLPAGVPGAYRLFANLVSLH